MKYIFLDIDGVLNNNKTVVLTPEGHTGISDNLAKRLGKIISQTGAKPVLTSSWRYKSGIEDTLYMRRRLRRYNAIPVGEITESNCCRSLRGASIKLFLETHPHDEIVILDDYLFDFYEEGLLPYLILTNPETGLTMEDVENAVKILNGENLSELQQKIIEKYYL